MGPTWFSTEQSAEAVCAMRPWLGQGGYMYMVVQCSKLCLGLRIFMEFLLVSMFHVCTCICRKSSASASVCKPWRKGERTWMWISHFSQRGKWRKARTTCRSRLADHHNFCFVRLCVFRQKSQVTNHTYAGIISISYCVPWCFPFFSPAGRYSGLRSTSVSNSRCRTQRNIPGPILAASCSASSLLVIDINIYTVYMPAVSSIIKQFTWEKKTIGEGHSTCPLTNSGPHENLIISLDSIHSCAGNIPTRVWLPTM